MADKAFALDDMSVQDLTALIQSAEAKRAEKLETAKNDLVAEFRERASTLGLSFDALMPSAEPRKRGSAAGTVPVKYRGPNNEEWSGRGRVPRWLSEAEFAGRSRDEFKV